MRFIAKSVESRQLLARFSAILLSFSMVGLVSARTLVFQSQSESSSNPPAVDLRAAAPANQSVNAPVVYETGNNSINTSSGNSELFFMIEQLQTEVRELRGALEEQGYEIRRLQEDGKSRYQDLDARVLELSKRSAVAPTPASPSDEAPLLNSPSSNSSAAEPVMMTNEPASGVALGGAKPPSKPAPEPTEEQKMEYQQAYALIKDKAFDEAIDRLHKFIEHYPEGELAGNAYYWLGEVYMALPKLEQARQAFTVVVGSFSDHRKVADALFKLGVVYDRMQDPKQSEKYLNEVQTKFPESTAAKLARSYRINR